MRQRGAAPASSGAPATLDDGRERPRYTSEESTIVPNIVQQAARAALSRKAEELTILDVRGLVSYCDFFIICNATNRRQAHAIAEAVQEDLRREAGRAPIGVEGLEACRWVLIDFGDVVIHVFDEPLRGFYDLDGLWTDAPRVPVEADPAPAWAGADAHA